MNRRKVKRKVFIYKDEFDRWFAQVIDNFSCRTIPCPNGYKQAKQIALDKREEGFVWV